MLFIVASGMVNIYIAGLMRRFAFSNSFVELLVAEDCAAVRDVCSADDCSWRAERRLASTDSSECASRRRAA